MAFQIKRGDTKPYLRATLRKPDNRPMPLGAAVVRFNMAPAVPGTGITLSRVMAVNLEGTVDAETGLVLGQGVVEYRWAGGNTATASVYRGEFEVTFADGSVVTFPNKGYIDIEIEGDLA